MTIAFAISCKNVLNTVAPWKKKFVRGNHSPFMNKALSKAIMVRTRLSHSSKAESRKIKKATICNETIVFHFCEKVREITTK